VLSFLSRPVSWLIAATGLMLAGMTAFVVFQPVKVIPRMADGPPYALTDQEGQLVSDRTQAGRLTLFGFGTSGDFTGRLEQTIADFKALEAALAAEGGGSELDLALILYDEARDTREARQTLAQAHDAGNWLLLGGPDPDVKRVIGQGFGVYYEAVPAADLLVSRPELRERFDAEPAPGEVAYLQAERYILVDEQNIIRAEYKAPLDIDIAVRDVNMIIRERESTGAERVVNEAAHLFLCYP